MDELLERPDRKEAGVLLVATNHPCFHNLRPIIKYLTFLYAKEKIKGVFTPALFLWFHSGYSLRNYLVRAKVYPLIRELTFRYGKSKCDTCCNIKQTDAFVSFVTKKDHSFSCDSKCLIYLFYIKFVIFSILVPQLIDSNSGETTTIVTKWTQQLGEHPTKTISINFF